METTKTAHFSNSYFQQYMDLCPNEDPVVGLETALDSAVEVLKKIGNSEAEIPYADGKWTIKEVLAHIIDTERVFAYRALRIARNDKTVLSSFDHVSYAELSGANDRSMIDIVFEFMTVRNASISLFKSFPSDAKLRVGKFADAELDVISIGKIMGGHGVHHMNVILEKYLKK